MTIKSYRVFFTPKAEKDLRVAWKHIAQHNFRAADRFYDALKEKASKLKNFPERGAPRDDLLPDLRMLVEQKYLIFYRVEEDVVRVLRVIHGAQDLTQIFN
jgi:toxin ParE1/3/4